MTMPSEKQGWADVAQASIEEAEAQQTENIEAVEEEEVSTEVVEDEVSPDEVGEEEVLASEDVVDDVIEEEAAPTSHEWDGQVSNLPPAIEHDGVQYDLSKTFKQMHKGYTQKMGELADERKQLQTELAELRQMKAEQKTANVKVEDPRPANPTEAMDQKDQEARWDEIAQWNGRQSYRQMVKDGSIPNPDRVNEMTQQQEQQVAVNNRMNLLRSQEGYDEKVEAAMLQATQNDPYALDMIRSDDGALTLFKHVKTQMEADAYKKQAADNETKSVQRKAKAARNTVSRSTSAPAKSAAENFKKWSFKDAGRAALDEHGG